MRSSRTLPGQPYVCSSAAARRRHPDDPLLELGVKRIDVELGEKRDVLAVIAQRRQRDRQNVEAVKQVAAETPFCDFLVQLPVGRGNDADVDPDVRRPADAFKAFLLEEAQQLGLQRRHHLRDLVEKHRAAVGALEQPALLHPRIGKRAALVPEQFTFQQVFWQRRTRNVHERTR